MGPPVRAVLTMTVLPAAAAEFERRWAEVADWVQRRQGCLRQALGRRTGPEETTYVITSDWVDRPTYHRFETSDRQDEMTAELRRLRVSVRMEVLDIVDHREPE